MAIYISIEAGERKRRVERDNWLVREETRCANYQRTIIATNHATRQRKTRA